MSLRSQPPAESRSSSVLVAFLDLVGETRPLRATVGCVALTVLVGVADYTTGAELSFALLYLVPVFLASGGVGPRAGLVVSALAAGVWLAADAAGRGSSYAHALVPLWNTSARFLVFWFVSSLVSSLRRLASQERALSHTDPLSKLPNTRGFFEQAEVEVARAARTGQPLSLAYVDIDDFKTVNDTWGHTEGDRVIACTGEVVGHWLRSMDAAGRLGGDEFAILLPETDQLGAEAVVRRLQRALGAMARDRGWPIGFSIGVVTFTTAPRCVDDAITRVDALMYEVKRSGKHAARFETDEGPACAGQVA